MTISAENATPPKSTKSRNSNSSVQIQIQPKSQVEFVPRDTETSEFLDLAGFEGVAILVETVLPYSIKKKSLLNLAKHFRSLKLKVCVS